MDMSITRNVCDTGWCHESGSRPAVSALRLLVLAAAIAPLGSARAQTARIDLPTDYVSGYTATLAGEELRYHSPLPYVDRSLLVRSLDRTRSIEWQTAPVPDGFDGDRAVFVIMAGIDVHAEPRSFDLLVNGEPLLSFSNPMVAAPGDTIVWSGERGVRAAFHVTLIDKYGDAMGYIFVSVPRELWNEDRSVRLGVAGESAGVPTWFMIFKEPMTPHVIVQNAPALMRRSGGNVQIVRVDMLYLDDRGRVRMQSPIGAIDTTLAMGHSRFLIPVPEVEQETTVDLEFEVDGQPAATPFAVLPTRQIDMYLIHHTHLDIGYTHHQDEVERMQWSHLEEALRLGAASESYPEEARFVWNPEGLWAVETYLENHSDEENERLLDGIRRGWIQLDGMYANLLTGIASSEGLMRNMEAAQRLSEASGVPIESALLSDIPGFTWGLVPVLAQNGIKYLSIGPNFGHRIGHLLEALGDKPFYWESPSGQERVLTWVSGAGYALFHSGLGYSQITRALDEESVFQYVDQLVEQEYPYDVVYLRYNIGSDNGPPDPNLADAVRDWNRRFVSPRLIISTVSESFAAFESRYGDQLPVLRGDLTGHWEDGAASSARQTASVRRTAEKLTQAEALAAILGADLSEADLYEAWRNVILYYEHTWGSWNSISEPESEFTLGQWEHKREFADQAAKDARRLWLRALVARRWNAPSPESFDVINTSSWPRSEVVTLSREESAAGDSVVDESGRPVRSQRLVNGELAFLARDVPAFGSRRYRLLAGAATQRGSAVVRPDLVATHQFRVEIDTLTGVITSLFCREVRGDLVSKEADGGLNRYVYVAGRDPANAATSGRARVLVRESGPLVYSLRISAPAPGADARLRSEITLYEGAPRIEITNWVDKSRVYDPEAVLYRFAFNVPDPQVRVDVPWGSFRLEHDQLPGASKNYMSVQRWVDIHNERRGITVVSIDAPMIQLGEVRTDAIVSGWLEHIEQNATLYSYAMNNYWETNYKAAQDGIHEFRYALRTHNRFDESESERFAIAVAQPLVAVPVEDDAPAIVPPVRVDAERAVVTLLRRTDDGDLILRLYNPGEAVDGGEVVVPEACVVRRADVQGRALDGEIDGLELEPYEIRTLRVVCAGQ